MSVTQRTRVISITGGKGGVGKSSVAANLAVTYAKRNKVLVLDADLGMADMNLLLGVAPEASLLDVLDGAPADRVLVKAHGLSLLPACNASSRLVNMTDEDRRILLMSIDTLSDRFDTLIVDCAAGIGANSTVFAAAAPDVIVVVTADPTSMADAYASLKVLNKEHRVRHAYLLPNGVRSAQEAESIIDKLIKLAGRFLDMRFTPLPAVPFDPAMRAAGAAGVPLAVSSPDSPASRAIAQVARRIDTNNIDDDGAGAFNLFWRRAFDAYGSRRPEGRLAPVPVLGRPIGEDE